MGASKLYEEQILKLLENMPEESMAKIISLIEEEKKRAWLKAIDEAVGKFKNSLSSTEEFMNRKEEEKLLDR